MKAALFGLCGAAAVIAYAQTSTVVIRPLEIDDVLVNPGMGIQTFQRFDGDPINQGQRWSEVGPEGALKPAGSRPDYPESSVAYFRWFWSQIQPEAGRIRWEVIDTALEGARKHGQTLMIRVMPYDAGHPVPEWYRQSGARRANAEGDPRWKAWVPDASDPLYMNHFGGLIRALGERYDGHPDLESVDISIIGYWGENWGPYSPPISTHHRLMDFYFQAFKRTPLLMNFDLPEQLSYAVRHGAGWRLDCWGDLGNNFWEDKNAVAAHMLDIYPQLIVRGGGQNAWQRGPVSLETCWVPATWKEKGFDIDYILDQGLRWNVSTANIKSTAIPPEWKEKFREFEKKMGYRFVLKRFEHPQSARAGGIMPVKMWWLNKGVAPVYRDYVLALRIGGEIIELAANVRGWLPGDALYEAPVYIPATLKPGPHNISVALLDPWNRKPAIKLAMEGRERDGWYRLGSVDVR
jgi:hypothetical protein